MHSQDDVVLAGDTAHARSHDAAQLDHAFESGGHGRHDTNGGAGHRRKQCCVVSDRCSETRQEGRGPVGAIAARAEVSWHSLEKRRRKSPCGQNRDKSCFH